MKNLGRRKFLSTAVIGGSSLLVPGMLSCQSKVEKTAGVIPTKEKEPTDKLFTRRLDEMTSREVEIYLEEKGNLVFIPYGPVSGHGALIPMGMHAHWANALSLLMARKANGLVFPPIFTVQAGATQTFRGTVNFSTRDQAVILKEVARDLFNAGFSRVVLVAGTNPEDAGGKIAVRELIEEFGRPFWNIVGERLLKAPEVQAIYEGYPGNFGETLLCLAALKILGRERPIPMAKWAQDLNNLKNEDMDQPTEIQSDINELRKWGDIGFRYFEEGQHGDHGNAGIMYKGRLDIDMTVEVLEKCADVALPALADLSHYSDWMEKHPFQYIKASERLNEQ
jgi:creatinine amidohydrolase/Fe(II)-dependent formamide hydrolase-like protein